MNAQSSLVNQLLTQLQGAPISQIASQLGVNSDQAQSAVNSAVPMLLGMLGNNATQGSGASDLLGALMRDHAQPAAQAQGLGGGDLLSNVLGSVLGGGSGAQGGAAILGHIFGGQQAQAQSNLGQASGLGGANAGQLLQILAPIVMSFLANKVQTSNLDAGGLGQVLGQERAQVQQQGGLAGSLLTSVLDQNGDGKLDLGDVLKFGASFLNRR
ncbi:MULTISPECIES: DUF937 domain-containing protein [Vitreoscilla]|uniref:DUF937 domain-containing protein n=1 Tax=Vitreoscilla stercoraria TaxID=61 RepID=A0ABY4E960_VITST|nr:MULTISPECIES: DUF937 domain-containing protein [Vitreoscilla]AUZ04253.1 hypothetical protein ADP71_04670 [Vitreoscilla sp. C1]UOO91997.1 DUF937 domain-containing protein [Vitreoscilla stercoraria]